MIDLFKRIYLQFLDFAYPINCVACGKQITETESAICFNCLWVLPRTQSHLLEENYLKYKFSGKIKVNGVFSFLEFSKKGRVQNILHHLKYKNQPAVAEFLGRAYSVDLAEKLENLNIDIIIPVPLHKARLKTRGYNQAEHFAMGLGEKSKLLIDNKSLIRLKNTVSQTKNPGRFKRFKNLEDAFMVKDPDLKLKGKVVALVDDVLTTGATLEVAGKVLWNAGIKELYIFTIAAAK